MGKRWFFCVHFNPLPFILHGCFGFARLICLSIPSLTIAACLTPTDPILTVAVVGGKWADKHVPNHLQPLLAAGIECNNGAASYSSHCTFLSAGALDGLYVTGFLS